MLHADTTVNHTDSTMPPGAMSSPPPGAMSSPPPGAMSSPPPGAAVMMPYITSPVHAGGIACVIFLTIALLWSGFAPLASTAIATGRLIVTEHKKTIQHQEGGIVRTIHVQEGDAVKQGDPLLTLDDTEAKAQRDALQLESDELRIEEARLLAERDHQEALTFPSDIQARNDDPSIAQMLASQQALFDSRTAIYRETKALLQGEIAQLKEEITGLEAQQVTITRNLALVEEKLTATRTLYKKQYASKQAMRNDELARNELTIMQEQAAIDIARVKQAIIEKERAILTLDTERQAEIIQALQEVQKAIAMNHIQQTAARDVFTRLRITAPEAGYVMGLAHHTIGGVIKPGEDIVHIVPQDKQLIVEAELPAGDIDAVAEGQQARVRLTAYKARSMPALTGIVSHISADSFTHEQTGEPFYRVHILLNNHTDTTPNLTLTAGMQTENYITTGSTTLLSYLLNPIITTSYKAFREE